MNVIIGGGITGLSCAYKLHKQGLPFLLIESSRVGGLIRSTTVDGFTLECGPNVLLLKPALHELLESLGLLDRVVMPTLKNYRQYVWYQGKPCEVPRSPLGLARSSLLSFAEKLQLLKGLLVRIEGTESDESVEELFSRFLPRRLVQRILDPALRGIYGGRIASLSSELLFPGLFSYLKGGGSLLSYAKYRKQVAQGRARICVLRGGAQVLIDALKAAIPEDSIVERSVVSIHPATADLPPDMRYVVQLNDGKQVVASRVFITTSGPATANFLQPLAPHLHKGLETLSYAPILVAHAKVPRHTLLPERGFGILFPFKFQSNLLGVMFNSMLFPHVAPPNYHLLTLCFGGIGGEEVLEWTEDRIRTETAEVLQRTLGVTKAELLNYHPWQRAVPQLDVGRGKVVEEMRRVEREHPGIYFAGVDLGGVGVPDRVTASQECVEKIAA